MTINEIVQERLDKDTEFLNSIKDLPENEKISSTEARRQELLEDEFKTLNEKAGKATKAEELANNYKKRSEEAESELKKYKPAKDDKSISLTTKDHLALVNAKVHEDDVDELLEYAKFKNLSIADALKSPVVKATIEAKTEERRTAQATSVRATRSKVTAPTGETLIEEMSKKGEDAVPEPGSEEAEAIFWARRGRKPI